MQRCCLVAVSLGACFALPAQGITTAAKTLNGWKVTSSGTAAQTIPPSTDLSAGAQLNAGPGIAQVKLTLAPTAGAITAVFASISTGSGRPALQVGNAGPSDVELRISAPRRLPVQVRVVCCGSVPVFNIGTASVAVQVGSTLQFFYAPSSTANTSCGSGGELVKTFSDYVDTTPLVIYMSESASTTVNENGGVSSVSATVTVTFPPDVPCRIQRFATGCGAILDLASDFTGAAPGVRAELWNFTGPSLWVLALGDRRASLPLPVGNCVVYDNLVLVVPMTPVSWLNASLTLVPPPIPNLYCVVQGGTWNAGSVLLSDGFELFCK